MKLDITGRRIALTESITNHAENLFSKLNEHFPAFNQKLTFSCENDVFKATADYHTNKGAFVATAEDRDLYVCITKAKEKIETQLRKKKETEKANLIC